MNDNNTTPPLNYLTNGHTVKSWLLTVDHKRIGILYLIAMTCFFLIGATAATLFRLELATHNANVLANDTYNRLFTMHGIIMVFFFLIPAVPGVLGNFFVPLMIGAKDVAFPRLNLASWYIYMAGGLFTLAAIIGGGIDTGWTFYTPYSSVYADSHVILAGTGVFITGFSSILTGLNFIVTIHKMRAPGLTWMRLPLFIWAQYSTAIINVLGTPVLAITLLLVLAERVLGFGIFDPQKGGDPVLYQHMFWFYSHPAVYIMILPGFGVVSEVLACFSRKRIYGYEFVAFSSLAIAAIGFFVWGHHMFTSSQSPYAGLIFSILTYLVGIPTAIKIFNWTATLYKGSVQLSAPMLYTLGFIGLFLVGGLTGLFLATKAINVHLHDTYFVVAHFHYVMVGGMMMAWLAGLHFWWPKMFGKLYNEFWARVGAVIIFFGFNFTFFPQFIAGYMGMPRRYHVYDIEYQPFQMLSTAGAFFMGIGLIICLVTLVSSLITGKASGKNPWKATGLEWNYASSPPDTHNFTVPIKVDVEAYDYTDERIYQDA
ncbi:MAG: cbb3-type cytochrome c oxidase subunit I [Verrucomicrobia bacterium]|nr:cbb3-type cytochrome c oxidase subunit I [Verrucomicrobiota bacterium]MCH8525917.1 cbb3-type cytochrome c oxidase subunit I [Kiritimatiellia bacterium]